MGRQSKISRERAAWILVRVSLVVAAMGLYQGLQGLFIGFSFEPTDEALFLRHAYRPLIVTGLGCAGLGIASWVAARRQRNFTAIVLIVCALSFFGAGHRLTHPVLRSHVAASMTSGLESLRSEFKPTAVLSQGWSGIDSGNRVYDAPEISTTFATDAPLVALCEQIGTYAQSDGCHNAVMHSGWRVWVYVVPKGGDKYQDVLATLAAPPEATTAVVTMSIRAEGSNLRR